MADSFPVIVTRSGAFEEAPEGSFPIDLFGAEGGTGAGPKGDKGDKGDTGPTGPTGPKGDKGDTGDRGEQGPVGERGDPGPVGAQGPQGEPGDTGPKGDLGPRGADGKSIQIAGYFSTIAELEDFAQGLTPEDAGKSYVTYELGHIHFWDGTAMVDGGKIVGPEGASGPKGDAGATGAKGDTGATGADGLKGDKGDKGDIGPKGDKGDTGTPGPRGDKGDKGDKGDTGSRGSQGVKGERGGVGATGPSGATGPKGDKGDPGAPGAKGDTGARGEAGQSLVISGYVEKLSDLPTLTAEDAGQTWITMEFGHLHFWTGVEWIDGGKIVGPQGPQGPRGEQGVKGDSGVSGPKGEDGDAGPSGQKGDKGDEGPAGPKGDKGDTGSRGETGLKGDRGPQGIKGDAGPAGKDGHDGWGSTAVTIASNYTVKVGDSTVYVNAPQDVAVKVYLPRAETYGVGKLLVIKDVSGLVHNAEPITVSGAVGEGVDGSRDFVMGRPHGYVILVSRGGGDRNAWQVIGTPLPGLNYTVLDWTWGGGFRPNSSVNNGTLKGAHMYSVSSVRIVEPKNTNVSVQMYDSTTKDSGFTAGSIDQSDHLNPTEVILNTSVNGGFALPRTQVMRHFNFYSNVPSKGFPVRITNLSGSTFSRVVVEFQYQVISDLVNITPESTP